MGNEVQKNLLSIKSAASPVEDRVFILLLKLGISICSNSIIGSYSDLRDLLQKHY